MNGISYPDQGGHYADAYRLFPNNDPVPQNEVVYRSLRTTDALVRLDELIASIEFPTTVKLRLRRLVPLIEMLSQLIAKICWVLPRFRAEFWLSGRVELTTEP